MGMPSPSVVVPCGRPIWAEPRGGDGALAPDVDVPSAGRCIRRAPAQHAIWACGGPGEVLTGRFIITRAGRQVAGGTPC